MQIDGCIWKSSYSRVAVAWMARFRWPLRCRCVQNTRTITLLMLVSFILCVQHQHHSHPHCEIAGGKDDKPWCVWLWPNCSRFRRWTNHRRRRLKLWSQTSKIKKLNIQELNIGDPLINFITPLYFMWAFHKCYACNTPILLKLSFSPCLVTQYLS